MCAPAGSATWDDCWPKRSGCSSDKGRVHLVAASAAFPTGCEGQVVTDSLADLILDGTWSKYDASALQHAIAVGQCDAVDVSSPQPSKRIAKLAPAFSNYRKSRITRLLEAKAAKRTAGVQAAEDAGRVVVVADVVFTDDDLDAFIKDHCSFESYIQWRRQEVTARKDPTHPHHGKPLPRFIPPVLIQLFGILLEQTHTEFYQQHFGPMSTVACSKQLINCTNVNRFMRQVLSLRCGWW